MNSLLEPFIERFLCPMQGSVNSATLGPSVIHTDGGVILRKDFHVDGLATSLFEPSELKDEIKTTIIYCHSYNSNRSEALSLMPFLYEFSVNVLAFDFSRVKEGKYDPDGIISLGMYQPHQLTAIVKWAATNLRTKIVVWGRSMGAFVALRYQTDYGEAMGLVLDSPYLSLEDLIVKAIKNKIHLPEFVAKEALRISKPHLASKLGFNIECLNGLIQLKNCKHTPVVFVCSKDDELCGKATETIYENYPGRKKLLYTDRLHNESREQELLRSCFIQIDRIRATSLKLTNRLIKQLSGQHLPGITQTTASMHSLPLKSHPFFSPFQKMKQSKARHSPTPRQLRADRSGRFT